MTSLEYVTCDATAASCRCIKPIGHDGPHECSPHPCNGAWTGNYGSDDFGIVRFPELPGWAS